MEITREDIARQTEEFLSKGGEIENIVIKTEDIIETMKEERQGKKTCQICGETKSIGYFYKTVTRYSDRCKKCQLFISNKNRLLRK